MSSIVNRLPVLSRLKFAYSVQRRPALVPLSGPILLRQLSSCVLPSYSGSRLTLDSFRLVVVPSRSASRARLRLRYHGFYPRKGYVPLKEHSYFLLFLILLMTSIYVLDWPQYLLDSYHGADTIPENKTHEVLAGSVKEGGQLEVELIGAGAEKKRSTFRDKRIIQYEDRIRQYSTPDKIFRYFATVKLYNQSTGSWEVFMTPEDFVRSITPGTKQPDGLGLDQFKKIGSTSNVNWESLTETKTITDWNRSVFKHFGQGGLISFSDYLFLLTVLSTPERQFVIAFRMFDENGDGTVDVHEFERVQSIIRSQRQSTFHRIPSTATGQRHRDHQANTVRTARTSALSSYFFGKDLTEKLTIDRFLDFYHQLQDELLRIEFNRYPRLDDEAGRRSARISERNFCKGLLVHAGLKEMRTRSMLARVKRRFSDDNDDDDDVGDDGPAKAMGITFDEYRDFFTFLRAIGDVDTALTFYTIAGASIDQETFKHVAKTVAKVRLSSHVVDVVFTLFDENDDGKLSNKEFVAIMKNRVKRGLDRPKDLGFVRKLSAICQCVRMQFAHSIQTPVRPSQE